MDIQEITKSQFSKLSAEISFFYAASLSLISLELLLLFLSMPFLFQSAFFAVALTFFLFTLFAFFVARNYAQSRWIALGHQMANPLFLEDGNEDKKIATLFQFLRGVKNIKSTSKWIPRFFQDYFQAILIEPEQIEISLSLSNRCEKLIQKWLLSAPLSGEAHAAYAELHKFRASLLYVMNRKEEASLEEKNAIEELHILLDLYPSEPWIYAEMTRLLHKTENWKEEIALFERWSLLESDKPEIKAELANRLFKSGMKAKGFKIYAELKIEHPKAADALLVTLFE